MTALMVACLEGHLIITRILIRSGADVTLKSNDGRSALHHLFNGKRVNLLKNVVIMLLQNNADINLKDHKGKSPLILACQSKIMQSYNIQILLQRGAQVDLKDNSALMRACEINDPSIVEELLNSLPEVDFQDNEGKSALMYAIHNDHQTSVIEQLLEGAIVK